MMKQFLLAAGLLAFAWHLAAENVFFNGSFELGADGAVMQRQIRPDTNPKLEYLPLSLGPASPGGGKNSLCIRNPYGEKLRLRFREVLLKPDTEYVLEFKGRCSAGPQKGSLQIVRVKRNAKDGLDWTACSLDFTLDTGWKTFRRTFNTKQYRLEGYAHPEMGLMREKNNVPSDFYFDDFRIYEGNSSPVSRVNVAIVTDEFLTVADGTAGVPAVVKIGNFSDRKFAEKVTVFAKNDWDGKTVSQTLDVSLAPGEIQNYKVNFKLNYGCFTLGASAPGISPEAVAEGSMAVLGKYTPEKLDFGKDFCISFNGGVPFNGFPDYPQFGYVAYNAPVEKLFAIFAQMGCRLLREHDLCGYEATDWYVMEPEKGQFDFRHLDYCLSLYEKYHIECCPCIGDSHILRSKAAWWSKTWPDWVYDQCYMAEHASYNWGGTKGRCYLPPTELWRKYVYALASHAKGRLRYYELFNEPNGVMSAKSYVPVLKATYEEVKKADPEAKIIGICVTEDFGANIHGFVEEVLDLKGGDYFDYASFHPYTSRELGSPNPADKMIAEFRQTLKKKTGRDVPLWNTELYFVFDTLTASGNLHEVCRPNQIALRVLTDLGEGVVQSANLNYRQILKLRLNPHHDYRRSAMELVPDYNFVVNNALARFFEAAKVQGKHRFPGGVIAYSFRKDGRGVAALWNYERRKGISADLSGFTVYDMFGNELKPGKLPVNDVPYYLRPGKNQSDEAFFAAVKNIRLTQERPVLVSSQVRKAGNRIFATLLNQSGNAVSGFAGFRGDGVVSAKAVRFMVPAGRTLNVELPLKASPKKQAPVFTLFVHNQMTETPVAVTGEEMLKNGETKTLSGKEGFSGSWKMMKKDGKIKLEIHVNDATDSGADNKNPPWDQDAVELFFDFDPLTLPLNHADVYTKSVMRLFLLPRLAGEKQLQIWSAEKPDVKYAIKPAGKNYDVTLEFPCPSDVIGFSIKFNDAKPGTKLYQDIRFAAGKKAHCNRLHFHLADFR